MGFSLSDLGIGKVGSGASGVIGNLGGIGSAINDKLLGGDAADAARQAAAQQRQAGQEAFGLFEPFRDAGIGMGLNQASFLIDPQAQFDFLQSNPLFQMGLDNLNLQTQKQAMAGGRVGTGDTSQQFINNALLAATPLIGQQKQSIGDLMNLGMGASSNMGNLLTGMGAAEAAGTVGASNAQQQGISNIMSLIGLAGGLGG